MESQTSKFAETIFVKLSTLCPVQLELSQQINMILRRTLLRQGEQKRPE